MYIGLDDTDSREGMCTTYLCTLILRELRGVATVVGLPRLIRLNPNIPYKTRGNGALCFEVHGDYGQVWDIVMDLISATAMGGSETNPGAVLLRGRDVPPQLSSFYRRALHEEIQIEEAKSLAYDVGASIFFAGTGRGLIGALASLGADLSYHTFELIAYRELGAIGTRRHVDGQAVQAMDRAYSPLIFDSFDWKNNYVAIAPNAPCPVLYGLRGVDSEMLYDAASRLQTESISMSQLFITNQATDAHIERKSISNIVEYNSVRVEGTVSEKPHFEHKGHLFFSMDDGTGSIICAAYEPTKEFRAVVKALMPGDRIAAYGGVKSTPYGLTLNLEKMQVQSLGRIQMPIVPSCCGKSMQSVGKGKGYRCRLCGARIASEKVIHRNVGRSLSLGWYEVPVIARRHLSRPLSLDPCTCPENDG